jgi:hypothetical protein
LFTTGTVARLFPAVPVRIDGNRYPEWLTNRDVTSVTGGSDPSESPVRAARRAVDSRVAPTGFDVRRTDGFLPASSPPCSIAQRRYGSVVTSNAA